MQNHKILSFEEKQKINKIVALRCHENIQGKIEKYQKYVSTFGNRLNEQEQHVDNVNKQLDDFLERVTALVAQKKARNQQKCRRPKRQGDIQYCN